MYFIINFPQVDVHGLCTLLLIFCKWMFILYRNIIFLLKRLVGRLLLPFHSTFTSKQSKTQSGFKDFDVTTYSEEGIKRSRALIEFVVGEESYLVVTGRSIMGSICSAAREIDRTVREDVPAKLKQYAPDPKIMQSICKTVKENAPDPRIFLTTAVEEMIKDSGLPGVRPLCRAWKESLRNRSGVASQMHSQDKVTDERERAKWEKCMMLKQTISILTNQPFSSEPTIKALKQSHLFQDCSDDVDTEDK